MNKDKWNKLKGQLTDMYRDNLVKLNKDKIDIIIGILATMSMMDAEESNCVRTYPEE